MTQEPKSVTYKEVADTMNALRKGNFSQKAAAEEVGKLKLYTTLPQRPWVDLTEDEIEVIEEKALTKQWAIRMALAAVKERNA